jgi:hypothetical protein
MAASTINTECKRYGCMKNLLACFANCRYTMRCDELRNELADKAAQAESDINHYLSERGRSPVLVQILKRGVKFDDKASRSRRKPVATVSPAAIAAKPRLSLAVSAPPTAKRKPPQTAAKSPGRAENRSPRTVIASRLSANVKGKATAKPRAVHRPAVRAKPQPGSQKAVAGTVITDTNAPRAASLRLTVAAPRSSARTRTNMPRRAKPVSKANVTNDARAALPPEAAARAVKPDLAARPASAPATPRRKATAKARKPAAQAKVYIIIEGQTASIVDEQGLMSHLFSNNSKNTRYFEASEVEARVQIVPKR